MPQGAHQEPGAHELPERAPVRVSCLLQPEPIYREWRWQCIEKHECSITGVDLLAEDQEHSAVAPVEPVGP